MSEIKSLGKVVYMDDGKNAASTCDLKIRDANDDGLISDPHSKLEMVLSQMVPDSPISSSNDMVECNPSPEGANIFAGTAADLALKRMGIHLFASPSILLRKSSDYTKQIPTAALSLYVTHMSQAEALSRTYLGDKSLSEIKNNLQKVEQQLKAADRFEKAVNANFGEKTRFEDQVKNRAYTQAAREIGTRSVVAANEAVASQNPKNPKIDEAIKLLREYRVLAQKADLPLDEISRVNDMVIRLLSVFRVSGPL